MSLAVGATHGNHVIDNLPTPKGLNLGWLGAGFDPFGVGGGVCRDEPSVGFTHG